jgi:PAS domain S-box-containing protein
MARVSRMKVVPGARKGKAAPRARGPRAAPAGADVDALERERQELRTLVASLERWVAQRTADLEAQVTERARAEDALREERNFVDAILGTTSALIVVLDREARIVRFNRACEETSGLRAEEVAGGRQWEALIPEEEREGVLREFDALRSGRYPSRHENHWKRRDGSLRLIAWSNTCVLDGTGAVQYVVGTGIDITEGRRAEHELLRRQLKVARLHRLQSMGALTALLAHEMNQPLAAITSYAEASLVQAEHREDGEKLRRNLQHIVQQAQRASRTIQELDEFLAKGEPERVATDLVPLLRQACGLVERLAAARGIRLDCGAAALLPRVFVQPMQVEHVVVNLLQNAIDAVATAGNAGGAVALHVVHREGEDRVRIGVEDSGPGVDATAVDQVFEPLYTTKSDGLGLGLSICRSIVEAHGGKIWAEPGPGGKFYFTLPVAP